MSDLALCVICADGEPQPIICRRCEDQPVPADWAAPTPAAATLTPREGELLW